MRIINKEELDRVVSITNKSDVIRVTEDLFYQYNEDIYLENVYYCKLKNMYYDYYYDSKKGLWFIYKCEINNRVNVLPKEIFYSAYEKALNYLTKCKNIDDFKKDCLVLARAYTNYVIDSRVDIAQYVNFEVLESYHFPMIVPFNQEENVTFSQVDIAIGFYQIVPDINWLKHVIELGVKTVQLRIKNQLTEEQLEEQISQGVEIAKKYKINLFINDYWQLAVKYDAYGVHLGQEDLKNANFKEISAAGLRLGISTHCYHERARALWFKPSYIAFGPIFPTNAKVMEFADQGIEMLQKWVKQVPGKVVAIGGINLLNVKEIIETGVDGFAVISAVTNSVNPEVVINELIEKFRVRG